MYAPVPLGTSGRLLSLACGLSVGLGASAAASRLMVSRVSLEQARRGCRGSVDDGCHDAKGALKLLAWLGPVWWS
jgi:hypothetical protein